MVLTLLLIVSNSAIADQYSGCIKDGDNVSFSGKVWRETFAGPPNYESIENGDEPETYWILTLDSPRCIIGISEDNKLYQIGNIARFQLVLTSDQYKKHKGVLEHRAQINGQIFEGITGHHHTKALIDVKKIKKLI